ncbi:MAG TPA: radical SAM protein, partial [Bacteroidia bacterium]|nr:radical SAM protein [Bacteroidia bacterium]
MDLIKKYNVPGPRYTSYPTVPYWNTVPPTLEEWKKSVKVSFDETNTTHGISIYIHLPFCESLCTYCGCNTRITVNHAVEDSYIDAVLKEWDLYLELFKETPRIKEIHLGGGTPTFFSPANLRKLIEGISAHAIICENAEFSFEAHPNNTTAEHLKTLFDLGFRRLSLGIQDFDPQVQAIVNRIQPFENVERVVTEA